MKIIFFDGYCNLCNGFVDLLMRRDKENIFTYASQDGDTAAMLLTSLDSSKLPSSIIYRRDEELFQQSDAVLKILDDLGGIWRLAKPLAWIPKAIRDAIYRMISKNRYKLLGRRDSCRIPTETESSRFLP